MPQMRILEPRGFETRLVSRTQTVFKADTDLSVQQSACVRIASVEEEFKRLYYGVSPRVVQYCAATFNAYNVVGVCADEDVASIVPDKMRRVLLFEFSSLLHKQGVGQSGILTTTGGKNVAYVDYAHAVYVFWQKKGWCIGVKKIGTGSWQPGDRIIHRVIT